MPARMISEKYAASNMMKVTSAEVKAPTLTGREAPVTHWAMCDELAEKHSYPRPIRVGAFTSSLVTFIMFEAAYFSEIMRAGIQSISKGQPAAASALGLTYSQSMRYIVLPQAFRNMLPVLLTQTIVLFQDTSLVYVLSIPDFLGAASKVAQRDGRLVEMYLFAAAVYFVISCVASWGVRRLQARIAIVR